LGQLADCVRNWPHVRELHPRFTLPICRGLSLAESPREQKSFGQWIMDCCVDALMDPILADLDASSRTQAVQDFFLGRGIPLGKEYRTPFSNYFYLKPLPVS
jgi:hypothetical protein